MFRVMMVIEMILGVELLAGSRESHSEMWLRVHCFLIKTKNSICSEPIDDIFQ